MKIGIYNANLNTMGGGEKHIGVIAEYLSQKHEVDFICSYAIDKDILSKKLNLDLSKVNIKSLNVEHDDPKFSEISADYDFFINSTYFSRLKSKCEKSAMLIFFPWITPHLYPIWLKKALYSVLKSIYGNNQSIGISMIDRLYNSQQKYFKDKDYISTYQTFIVNSKYTQRWVKKELQVESEIVFPPIDVKEFIPGEKKNIILSVGRFFVHSHNKKQLEMIKIFKEMYNVYPEVKSYEYHLCGSVDKDELSPLYIQKCREEAKGYPVFIHEDISFQDLKVIYSEAKIFWHASGFGEDPNKNPDKFEHFGMTTVEAMAAGAVPVVIAYGGQTEIVTDNVNGFLWTTKEELISKTINLINNENQRINLMTKAEKDSKIYSKEKTLEQLKSVLLKIDKLLV